MTGGQEDTARGLRFSLDDSWRTIPGDSSGEEICGQHSGTLLILIVHFCILLQLPSHPLQVGIALLPLQSFFLEWRSEVAIPV